MNSNEVMQNLSMMSLEEAEKRLATGTDTLNLEQLVSPEKVAKLQEVAAQKRSELAAPGGDMVVLLPGIMGSLLYSIRGVLDFLWINPLLFTNGHGNYLQMDNANVECVAFSLEKLTYLGMELALRNRFKLFEFPYDWRQPIEANAELLHASMVRWAAANSGRKFNLVGHSMGGLVIRTYAQRYPQEVASLVRKIIYLGTPLLGSTNAIQNLGVGNSIISTVDSLNPLNNMRQAVLSMPAIYQLLPVPPALFPAGRTYPANWNLFDASAWNVDGLVQPNLDAALAFHQASAGQPGLPVEQIMIAGCNIPSMTVVQRTAGQGGALKWAFPQAASGPDAGDGTVPLWSSTSSPDLRLYYVQCVHRDLPANDDVIEAVQQLIITDQCGLPGSIPKPQPTTIIGQAVQDLDQFKNRLLGGIADHDDFKALAFAL